MPPKKATKGNSRYRLSQKRAERAEALGGQYVEIEGDDGEVLARIPRAAFWDAKTYESVKFGTELVGDMEVLKRAMEPEEFAKLDALDLQLGDMKDLLAEIMKDVESPE
jgi:hypothetical protein